MQPAWRALPACLVLVLTLGATDTAVHGSPEPGPGVLGFPGFVALDWQNANTTAFQANTVTLPPGTYVATDHASYFYTTRDPAIRDARAAAPCAAEATLFDAPFALLDTQSCMTVRHPAIGCAGGMDPCWAAMRLPPHGEPPSDDDPLGDTVITPRCQSQGDNACFFGVEGVLSGVTAYEIRGSIAMTSATDSVVDRANHRWPGMQTSTGFLQAGTTTSDQYVGVYKQFCFYRPAGGVLEGWWSSSTFAFGDGTKEYRWSWPGVPHAPDTYGCYWNGVLQGTRHMGFSYLVNPTIFAYGEINFARMENLPGTFAANSMSNAVQYYGSGGWTTPSLSYSYLPNVNVVCHEWDWGVEKLGTNAIRPRSNALTQDFCNTGTAW